MKYFPVLLFVLFPPAARSQGITLPPKVSGEPGTFITVAASTKGQVVKWLALDKNLALFPPDLLKDSHAAVVISQKPGTYRLIAWTAIDGKPTDAALCLVIVGRPGPGPGPDPSPPPEKSSFQNAYDGETAGDKAQSLAALTAFYEVAANESQEDYVKTWGDLFAAMSRAADKLALRGKLPLVQKAVQVELEKQFPTKAEAAIDRKAAKKTLTWVASELGKITP